MPGCVQLNWRLPSLRSGGVPFGSEVCFLSKPTNACQVPKLYGADVRKVLLDGGRGRGSVFRRSPIESRLNSQLQTPV